MYICSVVPTRAMSRPRSALYLRSEVLQRAERLLPPPSPLPRSLSPVAGVTFLSFPPHSHAGSRRRDSTAAPRPEWNVLKFWNLKTWRGYLPEGSLESVSTPKTPAQAFSSPFGRRGFEWSRRKYAGYISPPPSLC